MVAPTVHEVSGDAERFRHFTGSESDKECLRLIGSTRFKPRRDIKSILVTGGAGFMYVRVTRTNTPWRQLTPIPVAVG